MSLMCNFGVCIQFLDVIYGLLPPNGSPVSITFIEFVTLHSNLLLCWHGFRDINITVNVGICWQRQSCFWGCLVNLTIWNTTYDWPTNHSPHNIIHDQLLIWTTRNQFSLSLTVNQKFLWEFYFTNTVDSR